MADGRYRTSILVQPNTLLIWEVSGSTVKAYLEINEVGFRTKEADEEKRIKGLS